MKIGNISLNPEAFKDYTKEQFFKEYKGKLSIDKSKVWEMICKFNKDLEKAETALTTNYERTSKTSKQGKKS